VLVGAATLLLTATVGALTPLGASASALSSHHDSTNRVVMSPPACSTTTSVSYGDAPATVDIASAGAVACITFEGADGDLEFDDVEVTSGSVSPFIDIFNPSGISTCAGPYDEAGGCMLDQTGTWMIQLTDGGDGTQTGTLNIGVQRVDVAAQCKTLAFGPTTVKGKIKVAAGISCFTFSGTSGGMIYAHVVGVKGTIGTPILLLGSPNGSEPCGYAELGTMQCSLNDTGTQSLLFFSNSTHTGSFNLSIQLLTNPEQCPTMTKNGASIPSGIDTIGQVRCFKFAGKKGEKTTTTLTDITGTLQPLMDLFNPSGTSILAGPTDSLSYTLNVAGTWVVLIEDDDGPNLGNFTIALSLSTEPASPERIIA